jgi:hypothetical protein
MSLGSPEQESQIIMKKQVFSIALWFSICFPDSYKSNFLGLSPSFFWSRYSMDNMMDGLYIAPAFMDKIVVHVAKNFMNLPNIKVPLILGIWGGKGQGKSFQCELVMSKLGIK